MVDRGDWHEDPSLRGLGEELRGRLGDEFREEAEEQERLAALAAARTRRLSDVAVQLRDRGDEVMVAVSGASWHGRVVAAGGDYLRLRTGGGTVDLPLEQPIVLRVGGGAPDVALEIDDQATTFRARLFQLEMEGRPVEVRTRPLGDLPDATIGTVGRDHVVLRDRYGDVSYVAISAVEAVIVRDD